MNILNNKISPNEEDTDKVFFYCNFCLYNSKNYLQANVSLDELQKDNIKVTSLTINSLSNIIKA